MPPTAPKKNQLVCWFNCKIYDWRIYNGFIHPKLQLARPLRRNLIMHVSNPRAFSFWQTFRSSVFWGSDMRKNIEKHIRGTRNLLCSFPILALSYVHDPNDRSSSLWNVAKGHHASTATEAQESAIKTLGIG